MALWLERRAGPLGGIEWEERVSEERGEDAIAPEETDGPVTHLGTCPTALCEFVSSQMARDALGFRCCCR